MKRIIIIEGNVSSLSRHHDEYSTSITRGGSEVVLDLTPEAADQIGASFREPMRVVLEIGTEESPDGGLTVEQLRRELASAQLKAEEARREVESLSRRLEFRPEAFAPSKHITKATVCKWLEEDAALNAKAVESIDEDNYAAKNAYRTCADDTRAIIARINAHKDSP